MAQIIKLLSPRNNFSPFSLAGLRLWLDANDAGMVTKDSSDNVSQWSDKSGVNNHAVQGLMANQPVWTANSLNGRASMRFNGSKFMTIANSSSMDLPATIFIVAKVDDAASVDTQYYIARQNGGNNGSAICRKFGGTSFAQIQVVDSASPFATSSATVDNNYNRLIFTAINSGKARAAINDAAFVSSTEDIISFSNATQNVAIGARPDLTTNNRLTGNICEILVYNSVLSDSNISLVNSFLSTKYGV